MDFTWGETWIFIVVGIIGIGLEAHILKAKREIIEEVRGKPPHE